MRIVSASLLSATLALAAQLPAQTAHSAATHSASARAGASHAAAGGCVKLPELSSKIPALPAGSPCPKALYTLTAVPDVRVDYAAPVEGDLAKTLGIESTSFTLAYVDTRIGTGALALPHKYYTVKYTGYLADGTVFDASDKHDPDGFTFPIGAHQVVAGWDTGFAGIRVGGKRRLFIPFQLAYGPNGRPPTIPPRAELIFDMELVSQSDAPPAPKTPPAASGTNALPNGGIMGSRGATPTPKPPTAPASAAPSQATPPSATTPQSASPANPASSTGAAPPAATETK